MAFIFDESDRTVVVVCDLCSWRTLSPNMPSAHTQANRHRNRTHADSQAQARQLQRRRHRQKERQG